MLMAGGKRKLQVILLVLFAAVFVYAYETGPDRGYTDAPGDLGNCTSCHDDHMVNSGSGRVSVGNVPAVYQPGQSYTLTVNLQDASRRRWGFELTAIDKNGRRAGTLTPLDNTTQIATNGFTGSDRQYVTHSTFGTFPGTAGGHTWQVQWTAPGVDAGTVRFYVAGNAADNSGTNRNDLIYTASASTESPTSNVTVSLQSRPDGLTLSPGSTYTISWSATGESNIDNIEVRYSTNNGADNFPFSKQIAFITDPSVTSVVWTVPDVQTSQAIIRIQVGKKSGDAVEVRSGLFTISGSAGGSPAPGIVGALVSGKKLYVMGENFGEGASIYMCAGCSVPAAEGDKAKKVSNDSEHPTTLLVSKKAGKGIERGSAVRLQVKNPDGTLSEPFDFTRPLQ
jgi:hypothetical protein